MMQNVDWIKCTVEFNGNRFEFYKSEHYDSFSETNQGSLQVFHNKLYVLECMRDEIDNHIREMKAEAVAKEMVDWL